MSHSEPTKTDNTSEYTDDDYYAELEMEEWRQQQLDAEYEYELYLEQLAQDLPEELSKAERKRLKLLHFQKQREMAILRQKDDPLLIQ
jgi:hypothetical protein